MLLIVSKCVGRQQSILRGFWQGCPPPARWEGEVVVVVVVVVVVMVVVVVVVVMVVVVVEGLLTYFSFWNQ